MVDLKEVHKIELEILRVIIEILGEINIRPFMAGGSCLGAVRHKGFIPWDDDIDIGLLREDFEKACPYLEKRLPAGYKLCNHHTEKEYPYNFAKVRKVNSSFVHAGDAHLKINQGIYVDIFPYDFASIKEKTFNRDFNKVCRLRSYNDIKCMDYYKNGKKRSLIQRILIFFGHCFVNKIRVQNKIDTLLRRYSSNKNKEYCMVCDYLTPYKKKRPTWEKNLFSKLIQVPFENMKVYIPANYDKYLSNIYGDYMVLPPEEDRVNKHDVIFFSTSVSYEEVR